jgi:hypothetical protein
LRFSITFAEILISPEKCHDWLGGANKLRNRGG